jgi:SAM-dependent methyltransferase
MECPVCEYPRAEPHWRVRDRFFGAAPGDFLLYRCRACGSLFQRAASIQDRVASFYPPGYWWTGGARTSGLERAYREWVVRRDQLSFVLSLPKRQEKLRSLDIGCGEGTFVRLALAAGLDAYGLEQSREAVSADPSGRLLCCSEKDLIERRERFNLLTLFHSLEHMTAPFNYLKTLRNLLTRPGGVVVQVPNTESAQAWLFGRRWYGLDCPRHVTDFSLYGILHLLGKAGYRIERVRHFSLRDNAAAMVSSLLPILDPMSQRVKLLRRSGRAHSAGLLIKQAMYLGLLVPAQCVAALEAALGRGGTVTIYATIE